MAEICAFLEAALRGEKPEILGLPDGHHAISGSADTTLSAWEADPGMTRIYEVNAVALTPDGHHVISGSADTTLSVWDLESGK